MPQEMIFAPIGALAFLTFAVLGLIPVRRFRAAFAGQVGPDDFKFGVCAVASSDPHCTFNPSLVPQAIDVIAPGGVNQATELDYTLGPVVLQGVTIP